eukprot:SAG22_NODE_12894_length_426_cov_0.397554_1_plen_108_part_01
MLALAARVRYPVTVRVTAGSVRSPFEMSLRIGMASPCRAAERVIIALEDTHETAIRIDRLLHQLDLAARNRCERAASWAGPRATCNLLAPPLATTLVQKSRALGRRVM